MTRPRLLVLLAILAVTAVLVFGYEAVLRASLFLVLLLFTVGAVWLNYEDASQADAMTTKDLDTYEKREQTRKDLAVIARRRVAELDLTPRRVGAPHLNPRKHA